MAELGAAAIGVGASLGAAAYTASTGFAARHENTHSLQVNEMRRHISDFEAAYVRGEVTEEDWKRYLAIRADARKKESEYEESIEAYKETPVYQFVRKWRTRRHVRKKKKAVQRANRSLRLHYYGSTSDASDASSITAESGSPPRSRRAHSDVDDEHILSWAQDVANSDSDDEYLLDVRGGRESHPDDNESSQLLGEEEADATGPNRSSHIDPTQRETVRRRPIEDQHRRLEELREAYRKLQQCLPVEWRSTKKLLILDYGAQYISAMERSSQFKRKRIVSLEAQVLCLQRSLNEKTVLNPSDTNSNARSPSPDAPTRPIPASHFPWRSSPSEFWSSYLSQSS